MRLEDRARRAVLVGLFIFGAPFCLFLMWLEDGLSIREAFAELWDMVCTA
jgi:hypothetical protein